MVFKNKGYIIMEWIINKKKVTMLICLLSCVMIVSILELQSLSKEVVNPYPTMQVANYNTDEEWGAYNLLAARNSRFWYRLNFSFPQQELKGRSLRSFRVINIMPPLIGVATPRVRIVLDEVDVTEYFEITSGWVGADDMEYIEIRWVGYGDTYTLEIIARDIALRNPKFYRDGANFHAVFEVGQGAQTLVPLQSIAWDIYSANIEPGIVDLNISSSFRVVGEFCDGEVFEKKSNTVHTYYNMTFLPCGCYLACICDWKNEPPAPPPIEESIIE